ncbi:MAG: Tm-1-like ATP-binding domain-containing protein [Rhizobiales bacterium]|nr:Tm-1-like ATP-binding domain-containing protein [Hyphomicrobiales bacterium]
MGVVDSVAALAVAVIGLLMERILLRPLGFDPLRQVLLTVGFAFLFQQAALDIWGGNNMDITPPAVLTRAEAAKAMILGGTKIVREKFARREIDGVLGVGGANGSTMACAIMRALPLSFPKVMVTPVAATAAVQWYIAESDIAMYPTIGDISLNRATRAAMANAAYAVAGMRGRGSGRIMPQTRLWSASPPSAISSRRSIASRRDWKRTASKLFIFTPPGRADVRSRNWRQRASLPRSSISPPQS